MRITIRVRNQKSEWTSPVLGGGYPPFYAHLILMVIYVNIIVYIN